MNTINTHDKVNPYILLLISVLFGSVLQKEQTTNYTSGVGKANSGRGRRRLVPVTWLHLDLCVTRCGTHGWSHASQTDSIADGAKGQVRLSGLWLTSLGPSTHTSSYAAAAHSGTTRVRTISTATENTPRHRHCSRHRPNYLPIMLMQ